MFLSAAREDIYNTLASRFAAISNVTEGSTVASGQPINQFSRRWRSWGDCSADQAPLLFQVQRSEEPRKQLIMPPSWLFKLDLVLYVWAGQDAKVIPSVQLNGLLDAIENAMYDTGPDPTEQALSVVPGGLTPRVFEAQFSGAIEIYEGVINDWLVALIPVAIHATV